MDEKKQIQLSKQASQGQALAALEGMEGWKIIKGWLVEARDASLKKLGDRTKVKTMEDVLWYQSKYEHADKTLTMYDNAIKFGREAQKKLDES